MIEPCISEEKKKFGGFTLVEGDCEMKQVKWAQTSCQNKKN